MTTSQAEWAFDQEWFVSIRLIHAHESHSADAADWEVCGLRQVANADGTLRNSGICTSNFDQLQAWANA